MEPQHNSVRIEAQTYRRSPDNCPLLKTMQHSSLNMYKHVLYIYIYIYMYTYDVYTHSPVVRVAHPLPQRAWVPNPPPAPERPDRATKLIHSDRNRKKILEIRLSPVQIHGNLDNLLEKHKPASQEEATKRACSRLMSGKGIQVELS